MYTWHFLLAALHEEISHIMLFSWVVTQCILPALSSPTYRGFPCGCASVVLMSSRHGIESGHEFAIAGKG